MSFVQEKLSLIALQSQGIFNLYVYQPANGDSSTDATASDYFSQSRFVGSDGWVDGLIFSTLSDGFFILQVQASGTTASQVGAGGEQIPNIEANLRGAVFVDMNNDDYTMTYDEAIAGMKVISNSGDGTKTLTWPTIADNDCPTDQMLVMTLATGKITLSQESGGLNGTAYPGTVCGMGLIPAFAIFSMCEYYGISSNASFAGVDVEAGAARDIVYADSGTNIIADSAGAQTFTIKDDTSQGWRPYTKVAIYRKGAGALTIDGNVAPAVTVTGNTTPAQGEQVWATRIAADTWVVG